MKKMSSNFNMSYVSLGNSRIRIDHVLQCSLQRELKLERGKEWWQCSLLGGCSALGGEENKWMDQIYFIVIC